MAVSPSMDSFHIPLGLSSHAGLKNNVRESWKSQNVYHSTWKRACCGQVPRKSFPSLVPEHLSPCTATKLDLDLMVVTPANSACLRAGAVLDGDYECSGCTPHPVLSAQLWDESCCSLSSYLLQEGCV